MTLSISDKAKDWLIGEGYEPAYGARPLKRAIQRKLLDPLSQKLIGREFHDGDAIDVDLSKDTLTFKRAKAKAHA
jgi:ATP-dependent Clp protease ATP-binding subunit ClpB